MSKYVKLDIYGKWAFLVILCAILLRVLLIYLQWPFNNSDEGTMNLMALHIAFNGEHPSFFYGQSYMGSMEAYIGALLFRLFGVSLFVTRLGLLLPFALFLFCLYRLTSRLYTKPFALFVIALLSLGSAAIIRRQLVAIGGYPEIIMLGALLFLLAYRLARVPCEGSGIGRWLLHGFWGLVAGFALWTDPLLLPYIATSGLLLLIFCSRELLRGAVVALVLGVALGGMPLIVYNLTAEPGKDSLSVLFMLSSLGYHGQQIPFSKNILGTFFLSLPYATGIYPGCAVSDFPFFAETVQHPLRCLVSQGAWGVGYMLLWTFALGATIVALRRLSAAERQERVRQATRLLLLVAAGLALVLYLRSPMSALDPTTNARYLVCLLISTPAVLWPLWRGLASLDMRSVRLKRVLPALCLGSLLLVGTCFLLGTAAIFGSVPEAQADFQQQRLLAENLLRLGATRIYTDYWTCHRLVFESRERIICSGITSDLQQDSDRYKPYRSQVQAAAHPFYVFPLASEQAQKFPDFLRSRGIEYRSWRFNGYVAYLPAQPVGVPVPGGSYDDQDI